jgi:hypothetical protein
MPRTEKLTYEFVRDFFKKHGCKMLDKEYKNARTHINYKCTCGNISKIIFDSFRRGHRCKKCATVEKSKKQTLTYDEVYRYFEECGCELLEGEYINVKTKMKYRCECGDISYINFNNFKNGERCRKCSIEKRSGKNHYEWVEDRILFEELKKFRQKCYKMLRYSLKQTRQSKIDRTHLMLGFTPKRLQKYIRNHPNWDKVKDGEWHIDHIYPIKAFLDYDINDIKLINSLDNLQPLSAVENLLKSDNYNDVEFEEWLEERNYEIQQ